MIKSPSVVPGVRCISRIGAGRGSAVLTYQKQFLECALRCEALRFGEFELKSGRISPYFFNAGSFADGRSLAEVGTYYAQALERAGIEFDMLFGPAYKGIPLATATAMSIWERQGREVPVAFNRKEEKQHGEGGRIMGAALSGRVLIVDDVITAGTAIRESIRMIEAAGGEVAGAVVALDRQERGEGSASTIRELETEFGFPVTSVAGLADLIGFLEAADAGEGFRNSAISVRAYRDAWGVASE